MSTSTAAATKYSVKNFSNLSEEEQAEIGTRFPIAWDDPKPVSRDNIAIFIIPNGYQPVRELKESVLDFQREKLKDIESFYGRQIADDDFLVQFWATDRSDRSGNSNLGDHGYVDEEGNLHRFPTYIPMSLIRDKMEGDILRINGDQGSFTLQTLQRPYRYARFGRFHETLKYLLNCAK